MASLGTDEIAKIRGEGTFRPEGQKKWLESLWEELKSLEAWAGVIAVGMFAMLAVLGNSIFTMYESVVKPSRDAIYDATQLKAEIDFRAGRGKNYLDNLVQRNKSGKASMSDLDTYKLIHHVTNQMVNTSRDNSFSSNSFLSRRAYASMYLLLAQLEDSEPDGNMRKAIDDTIASTLELEKTYQNIRDSNPNITVDEFIEKAKRQLKNLGAVTGTIYLTNNVSK